MKNMINPIPIFDAHCDTMYELLYENRKGDIIKNDLMFCVKNTKEYSDYIQVLALWCNPAWSDPVGSMQVFLENTINYLNQFHIKIVKTEADFEIDAPVKVILSMESGEGIGESLERLSVLYDMGLRSMLLVYNDVSAIGEGAVHGNQMGLTDFGFDVVKKMNDLGMIIDVSHLNERGFYDVMSVSSMPVIASHSNARAICAHPRNISDEQFLSLIANGGVCGINFYPDFLSDSGKANIDTIVKHIEHFMAMGGRHSVGLGSDFDGIPTLPEGIENNRDICKILERLSQLNYNSQDIENIAYGNMHRVFKKHL